MRTECGPESDAALALAMSEIEERLATGGFRNASSEAAYCTLDEQRDLAKKLEAKAIERPAGPGVPSFSDVFAQLHRIQSTLLNVQRVLSLCTNAISGGARSGGKEERVWQQNCGDAVKQLARDGSFGHFYDVLGPLSCSITMVRSGVRMVRATQGKMRGKPKPAGSSSSSSSSSQIVALPESRWLRAMRAMLTLPQIPCSRSTSSSSHSVSEEWAEILFSGNERDQPAALVGWLHGTLANLRVSQVTTVRRAVVAAACSQLSLQAHSRRGVANQMPVRRMLLALYAACVADWSAAAESARARAAKEAEFYQYKTADHRGLEPGDEEDEEEERAFREQFPDFHAMFNSGDDAEDDDATAAHNFTVSGDADEEDEGGAGDSTTATLALSEQDMAGLALSHRALFGPKAQGAVAVSSGEDDEGERLAAINKRVAASSVLWDSRGAGGARSELYLTSADRWAGAAMLVCTNTVSSFYSRDAASGADHLPRMHLEGNIAEAALLAPAVQPLVSRIQALLVAWPGQAVLVALARLCSQLLSLPLDSPLMKLLVGVEVLHRKANDWNAIASRELRVEKETAQLVQLTMRWRKMELGSWEGLLAEQENQTRVRARRLWAHIFHLLQRMGVEGDFGGGDETMDDHDGVGGSWVWGAGATAKATSSKTQGATAPSSSGSSSASRAGESATRASVGVDELFTTLDHMMRSSPLGEFAERLAILRPFVVQLDAAADVSSSSSRRAGEARRVRHVVANVCQYYGQYEVAVNDALSRARSPIEQKLKGLARIGKWDSQTYFSLRESAEKTHRQLHKCMKDYSESLAIPASTIIDRLVDGGVVSGATGQALGMLTKEQAEVVAGAGDEVPQERLGRVTPVADDGFVDVPALLQHMHNPRGATKATLPSSSSYKFVLDHVAGAVVSGRSINDGHFAGRVGDLSSRVFTAVSRSFKPNAVVGRLQQSFDVPEGITAQIIGRTKTLSEADVKAAADAARKAQEASDGEDAEEMDEEALLFKARRALKGLKKKAVLDLLRGLKRHELSHMSCTTQRQQEDMCTLFQLKPLRHEKAEHEESRGGEPTRIGSSSSSSSSRSSSSSSGSKAHSDAGVVSKNDKDDYFSRALAQLQRLRVGISGEVSTDLSRREVGQCVGFSENLF